MKHEVSGLKSGQFHEMRLTPVAVLTGGHARIVAIVVFKIFPRWDVIGSAAMMAPNYTTIGRAIGARFFRWLELNRISVWML